MGWGPEVKDRHELASPYIFVFHFRCGYGSATTCDGPLGSGSRIVPLRWRGSIERGGGGCLWGYNSHIASVDINHVLEKKKQFWITCYYNTHSDYNYFLYTNGLLHKLFKQVYSHRTII